MVEVKSTMVNQINEDLLSLSEDHRRQTFRKWVFSEKDICNADKMAEAGFVYTGSKDEPDAVECFFCGKSLDGWEPDDDPWAEHLKHAPQCSFAKLQKTQDEITLEKFLDLKEEFVKKRIAYHINQMKEEVEELAKSSYKRCCDTIDKL